jgi:ubiquinone/menaquinone biosynthesis C-methylase UbiE
LADAVGSDGEVTGIDQSAPFVEQARELVREAPNSRVHVGDAYALPCADGAFDAVHCERVLMHLEHPIAALREMWRVVRPRGRIVAAEPAWETMVIDHLDHEAIDLLIRQSNTVICNPRMGLELNRLLAEAGCVDRQVEVVAICSRDYAEFVAYGLNLSRAAKRTGC